MDELDNILKEFLVESYENLDQLDRDLVALESDPGNLDTLASIFRTIHTIKGTCGFLGLNKLESVTHVGENLLGLLRDGKLALDVSRTTALLSMVDAVRQMLGHIEQTGKEGDGDYSALINTLTALQSADASAKVMAAPATHPAPAPEAQANPQKGNQIAAALAAAYEQTTPKSGGVRLAESSPASPPVVSNTTSSPATADAQAQSAEAAEAEQPAGANGDGRSGGISDSSIRVDVNLLDKLMNLVGELVLARNQILQHSAKEDTTDSGFNATSQRLNLITTELQEGVMKTRMQPIGNIWSKFPRVVRDLALAGQKKIRIEMEGKDTELDKTIIEAIKDPLTHLVRNSADHGIERPESRLAAGKTPEGRLQLRAFHEGGQVNIEITDDGGGIDAEKIKQKALKLGLITPDQVTRMSEREALSLIFLPGFSTAVKVTNISGRGVGMDVVKTNIEKIGGTVDVYSTLGQGTTVKMKIPLTLAIIPALVITCGGDRYSIPQVSLLELVRLDGAEAKKGLEMIHGAPVYRLRGNLLPLVDLSQELGVTNTFSRAESGSETSRRETSHGKTSYGETLSEDTINVVVRLEGAEAKKGVELLSHGDPVGELHGSLLPSVKLSREPQAGGTTAGPTPGTGQSNDPIAGMSRSQSRALASGAGQSSDDVNIVILQAEDRQFGLVVEGIHDTEEIVVKPLGKQLKHLSLYSGATIMGDGTVALILDVLGLAQRANVVDAATEKSLTDKGAVAETLAADKDRQALLIFEIGTEGRMAMPLSLVARLEEFPRKGVERSGQQEVVQYRGEIMPLFHLAHALGFAENGHADSDKLQVVVYTAGGRSVGLVVNRIVDIVEEAISVQRKGTAKGLLESVVIQGRVTDMLDVEGAIQKFDSGSFEHVTETVGA